VTIAGFGGTGTSGKSTAQKTLATATDRDWRNSAFTLSGHVILPVTFLNVKAAMQGAAVAVSWSVSDEHNVLHYRVERSTDGSAFTQVGIVAYKAPTGSVNEYQFVDRGATGQRVQYRVRQVDTDGSVTLSPVVSIQRAAGETKLVLYPNPVQTASVVELTAMVAQQVQLVLTDVRGNRLMQQMVPVQKGRTVVNTLALQQLPSGMYLLSGVIDGRLCGMSFIKPKLKKPAQLLVFSVNDNACVQNRFAHFQKSICFSIRHASWYYQHNCAVLYSMQHGLLVVPTFSKPHTCSLTSI
jgi:hypothetical protein